jgi:hypothetical protein
MKAFWPRGHMPRSSASVFRGRAEPAPPRKVSPDRMALRGKARDAAEGGFLGGTHSVRPHSDAASEPRHNIIIGGKGTPGGLMGT